MRAAPGRWRWDREHAGLSVPLYAFVLGVGAKAAVPMSKATTLGAAFENMSSIGSARHLDKNHDRLCIDYESAFMQSGEVLGVAFGVLRDLLLPAIFIIAFLAGARPLRLQGS